MTSEVQKQPMLIGAIDWSQVSQAARLFIRKCFGLSYYEISKYSWHYNPDLFSQSMADHIIRFIEEHYPVYAPGKFKLTEADYERAAVLKTQGPT
ncbi:hypothetical protein H4S03_002601 [Coemansia sp. S3946]|nr:hypothetical protein H4S03_002601 [Coemansia sp. S3946]